MIRISPLKYKTAKKGFSLIEIMVGVSILSLIIVIATGFFKDILFELRIISYTLNSQSQARKTLKSFSAEVRSATQSNLGSYPIEQAASSSFVFYCNSDNDNLIERIRYFKDGEDLKRGITKPSGDPLSYDISNETVLTILNGLANTANPVFSYYDSSYAGTSSPIAEPVNISSIRLIKAFFEIDSDPFLPPGKLILTTQVALRNLKDNQ